MVKSFLAGGCRQEGVNPCLCSGGGAAFGRGMPLVQVWGLNLVNHFVYDISKSDSY